MTDLLPFFIIFATGVVFTEISQKLHLPYVTMLIVAGMILGPQGFGIIEANDTLNFIGSIGLIFLMFLAGSEIRTESFSNLKHNVGLFIVLNSVLPFLTGFGISILLGDSLESATLLGIVFISSSVSLIIPLLQSSNLIETPMGNLILSGTVIEDVIGLLLLAIALQQSSSLSSIPLVVFIAIVAIIIFVLRTYIPQIESWYEEKHVSDDLFESKLRFMLVLLFSTVFIFELIGLHAITAGFIVGMLLSKSINKKKMKEKVKTISYGIFVPTFFLLIGTRTDLSVINDTSAIIFIILIIVGQVASKFVSGFIVGKLLKFSDEQSTFVGLSTVPQLSTTLAIAYAAGDLLNPHYTTGLVLLSVFSALVAPVLLNIVAQSLSRHTKFTRKDGNEQPMVYNQA